MFKEIVFELSGGVPRTPHLRYLFEHPSLTARMQTVHSTDEVLWELAEVHGDSADLADFRERLEAGVSPPMLGQEILQADSRGLQYLTKWRRPGSPEEGISLEYMMYDQVGSDAILSMQVAGGRAEVKVAGPDGDTLLAFYREVSRALGSRFSVRLLRVGDLRPGWDTPRRRPAIGREERALVEFALAAGYYDNPKRCGVRELGEALGCSKSVVARKLRTIERKVLESLLVEESSA